MPLDMVKRAADGFYKRCLACVEAKGGHFKHMLKRKNAPLLEYDAVEKEHLVKTHRADLEVRAEDWEGEEAPEDQSE